jgi:hypothetical protein
LLVNPPMNFARWVAVACTSLWACGSSGSDTSGPGGGGSGGGVPEACGAYLDEGDTEVAIHIVNQRATSLFVRQCTPLMNVELDGTEHASVLPVLGTRCEDAFVGSYSCCDCDALSAQEIAPGASFDLTWSGRTFEPQEMPGACYGEGPGALETCFQAKTAPTGPLTFVFHFVENWNVETGQSDPVDVTQVIDVTSGGPVEVVVE